MPTFSILLPTRNRVELAVQAIETVRRQDLQDRELIVSDNASEDGTADAVRAIVDDRIKYVATGRPVSVTENWNNSLANSSGTWVLLLGDDDGLLPGTLSRFAALVSEFSPDLIYSNAYLFAYPGALPDASLGSLRQYGHSRIFERGSQPYLLRSSEARDLVRRAMKFEMAYTFNMQHSLIARRLLNELSVDGPFFRSPYPDFYATNALFLTARRILVSLERRVVIGLSTKSFGYYFFNGREAEGVAMLGNSPSADAGSPTIAGALPGNNDRTSWLMAMLD